MKSVPTRAGSATLLNRKTRRKKKVNNNYGKTFTRGAAARIIRTSLATLAVLTVSSIAYAQDKNQDKREGINFASIPSPTTSDTIAPPAGNSAFLLGQAVGTQGYVCLPNGTGGASWTVNGARPEATLFTKIFGEAFQIITHFLSPNTNPNGFAPTPIPFGNVTWQSSHDSSKVWGQPIHAITAG